MFILAEDAAAQGAGWVSMVLPFVLMFAVFYFLLIRPQQKKQKSRAAMLNALQKNDKVVTIGGIHGTITEITDDIVVLKVNDSTKLTLDRSSINATSNGSSNTSIEENK